MAKKTGAVRMNITVPRDLKKRMEQVGAEVNWSAVATGAFMVKLGHIAQEKAKLEMKDVVDRLRASKLQGAAEAYTEGRSLGDQWAKSTATAAELKRLEDAVEQDNSWDENFDMTPDQLRHLGLPGWVAEVITGEYDNDFWDAAIGDSGDERLQDPDLLRGFCDGALSVWKSVSSEVN